jgi:hypothetical protein
VLKAGDTMTGNLNVAATLITQNIVPNLNVTYDIGTAENRFNDIWLSNSSIFLGEAVLSANGPVLLVSGVEIIGGGNVVADLTDSYNQANTARNTANDAYAQANTARGTANDAYGAANTANTNALNAYSEANTANTNALNAYSQANVAYDQANTARDTANGAYGQANGAYVHANIVYAQANSAYDQANTARGTANDAYGQANSARDQANTARDQANNAYAEANLKLNIAGGTINGSLNVSGNLSITGNTTYYNVTTYSIDDPLIYLAANNDLSDLVDIGFMGGKNTAGIYSHTGLARDAGDGTWYLFDNLADEGHVNNVVDFANTTLAVLRANINANSILLTGNPVATEANLTLAYNQANSARDQANTARTTANDAYAGANTANTNALDAYGQANTARDTANGAYAHANIVYAQANTAYDQANNARDQANTARTTANDAYGAANTANTNAVNAYDQANNSRDQANTARNTANSAYDQANNAYAEANIKFNVSGGTVTGDVTFNGNVNLAANSTFRSNTVATTTQDVEVTVDTFSATVYRSALYQAQLTRTSPANDYETITISVVHDGSTVYLSQYGQNKTNVSANMGTFDATIAAGTLSLKFTPNVNVVTVKTQRSTITV